MSEQIDKAFYGHAGRKGKVGGSAPKTSVGFSFPDHNTWVLQKIKEGGLSSVNSTEHGVEAYKKAKKKAYGQHYYEQLKKDGKTTGTKVVPIKQEPKPPQYVTAKNGFQFMTKESWHEHNPGHNDVDYEKAKKKAYGQHFYEQLKKEQTELKDKFHGSGYKQLEPTAIDNAHDGKHVIFSADNGKTFKEGTIKEHGVNAYVINDKKGQLHVVTASNVKAKEGDHLAPKPKEEPKTETKKFSFPSHNEWAKQMTWVSGDHANTSKASYDKAKKKAYGQHYYENKVKDGETKAEPKKESMGWTQPELKSFYENGYPIGKMKYPIKQGTDVTVKTSNDGSMEYIYGKVVNFKPGEDNLVKYIDQKTGQEKFSPHTTVNLPKKGTDMTPPKAMEPTQSHKEIPKSEKPKLVIEPPKTEPPKIKSTEDWQKHVKDLHNNGDTPTSKDVGKTATYVYPHSSKVHTVELVGVVPGQSMKVKFSDGSTTTLKVSELKVPKSVIPKKPHPLDDAELIPHDKMPSKDKFSSDTIKRMVENNLETLHPYSGGNIGKHVGYIDYADGAKVKQGVVVGETNDNKIKVQHFDGTTSIATKGGASDLNAAHDAYQKQKAEIKVAEEANKKLTEHLNNFKAPSYQGNSFHQANPDDGPATHAYIASVINDPKYKHSGVTLIRDSDMVERNNINIKKNPYKDGHVIEFKVTEENIQKVRARMINAGGEDKNKMSMESPISAGSKYYVGDGVTHKSGTDVIKLYNDKSEAQALKGTFKFETKENDPVKAYKKFEDYLTNKLNLSEMKSKTSEVDQHRMATHALAWSTKGTQAKPTKEDEEQAKNLTWKEVAPGHFTHVNEGFHKTLMKHGLVGTQVSTYNASSVLKVLQTGGHNSTLERVNRGIQKSSGSPTSDINRGGADYIFTRPITTGLKGHSLDTQWGNIAFIYHPRILDRTDWWGSEHDNYGNTKNSTFAEYKGAEDYIKKMHNNHKNGGTSSAEITIKKASSANDLMGVWTTSSEKRHEVINLLKENNIHEVNGMKVEDFVVHKPTY